MRKSFSSVILAVMIALCFAHFPSFAQDSSPHWEIVPPSQRYLEWEAQQLSKDKSGGSVPDNKANSGQNHTGYIPFPVDLSHLAYDLPIEPYSPTRDVKAATKYDLRDYNYIPSAVRNQNPYDTCWAHASIGAMESNYMRQGYSEIELSEMHLAYFSFINSTKTKAFHSSSVTTFDGAMGHGGNSFYPTAIYSRLDGPVLESEVPYGRGKEPLYKTPESYSRVLRLKDVYYIGMDTKAPTVNEQRAIVKDRIAECGAVVANYCHSDSYYNTTSSGGTAFHSTSTSTNHAIQLIGWDDSYSKDNFKSKPSSNGAWLAKNSWGNTWGDSGYFWISYETYLTDGTAFVVEPVNSDLKCYYYDALGWTASITYGSASNTYAANAFQATRDGEKLSEIGFYSQVNNLSYEISIYTGQGTSMPSSPTAGTLAKTLSGTIPYAGYHTISVGNSPISLTKGQYFSIIVKYTGQSSLPVEMTNSMSPNVSIENGSFISSNGSLWSTGGTQKINATIKAFTTSSAGETKPTITTASLPAGTIGSSYSAMLSAYGATPITWTVSSGSLPDGLTLDDDTGIISGTPTTKDDYTFTITATNSKGSAQKQYTVSVSDLPIITTTAFSGYAGYAINAQMALSSTTSAKWSATSLPKGLKLNADTGAITGKPSKAGSYSSTITATISQGEISETVGFTIYEKPVKAALKTSKLPDIDIGASVQQSLTVTGTKPITIVVSDDTLPAGLSYAVDEDDGVIAFSGTPTEAGTFTIVVNISNIVNDLTGKKADTKKIKFKIKAESPVIDVPDKLPDGEVGEEYEYQVTLSSGTAPEKWSASGLPKGLTIDKTSGLISGTPTKYGTFNVTLQAQNNGGKDKTAKIPLSIFAVPEITLKSLKAGTTGKKYSVKLTATGEPSSWGVVNLPAGLELSQDKKGNYLIAGNPTTPGTNKVQLTASNSTGSDSKTFELVIKGVAPKIKATLPKTATIGSDYEGTIEITGTLPLTKLTYEIAAKDLEKANLESLEELGLTFTGDLTTGIATISGTPLYAVKGLPVQIIASNAEKSDVKKKISIKIPGTKPAFSSPSGKEVKETLTAGSSVSIEFVCTGSEKLEWSMKSLSGFTLTEDASDVHKATLTGTMPSSGKASTTITVANASGKATMKVTLTVGSVAASGQEDVESAEPEEPEQDEPEQPELGLSVGAERSVSEIGSAEREAIEREGYTIVAVLPELSVDVEGMYDLDVELDSGAEVGRELVWLAFPQNAKSSEDDEIVEFWDETGEETQTVPEGLKLKVSVWLREGVRYAPVIAVK